MPETDFNFDDALKALQAGNPLSGKDGVLTPLIKQLVEAALAAELESHLDSEETSNHQNGRSTKTIKSTSGSFELATPRDRTGRFEPQLIRKHQTHMTDEIERKILSLYALGSSYRDISGHIEELYGIDVSSATISAVTDKIIPRLKEWQQRPLESHYPFVWPKSYNGAIHYKVWEPGAYRGKAVYTVLGLELDGTKEILGLYLSENEGANFWLSILTGIRNRGVKNIRL